MNRVIVVGLALALSGCGLAVRQERQQQMAAARASMESGFAECETRYPTASKQPLARVRCKAEAAKVIKPFVSYPDLFDQDWATNIAVAEQVQAGKVTPAAGYAEVTKHHSEIIAEEQRRNLANRSVGAQESMAAAAWMASTPSVVVVRR